MPGRVDLHIHSSFSDDGDFPPEDIFRFAEEAGLSAVSITDHDTVDSVAPSRITASAYPDIEYIPGIELTTMFPEDGSQQHILGYFIDSSSTVLQSLCARIFNTRMDLANERLRALSAMGIATDEQLLLDATGGLAPTATAVITSVLDNPANTRNPLLEPYIHGDKKQNRVMLFYKDFFAAGRPAWAPFRSIPTEEVVQAVLSTGAVPVLAHPVFVKTAAYLDQIREYGIAGIEVYSSYHSPELSQYYLQYAEKHSLIATAGSDFHGPTAKPNVSLGGISGNGYEIVEQLKSRHKKSR